MLVVVIPAFLSLPREADQLARCAAAVLAQGVVDRLIVVDDGSPLPVPLMPGRVEVIRHPVNAGPGAARNRGIERALDLGASVVLFTDADCVPDPGWAETMVRFLAEDTHVAAGGVTRSLGSTLLDRYHDFAGSLNGRWLLPAGRELLYATTCNMAARAAPLTAVRFDERFPAAAGEDFDLCHRLRAHGSIGLQPAAIVRHDFAYRNTAAGFVRFLRLFRRYGQADALLWEKHPELRSLPSEACAAADVTAPVPPADPAAYRRAASSRVRPRRYRPALVILRHLARLSYKLGQARPLGWRAASAPARPGHGPGRMELD